MSGFTTIRPGLIALYRMIMIEVLQSIALTCRLFLHINSYAKETKGSLRSSHFLSESAEARELKASPFRSRPMPLRDSRALGKETTSTQDKQNVKPVNNDVSKDSLPQSFLIAGRSFRFT